MIYLASLSEETSDKINGYYILHTKQELDEVVADNISSNKVIIRGNFADKYFTPSGLMEYIQYSKAINRNLIFELEHDSNVVTPTKFVKALKDVVNLEEVLVLATKYPKEFFDTLRLLTGAHEQMRKELLQASSAMSSLQSQNDKLSRDLENTEYNLRMEQDNKAEYQSALDQLIARINYQYNKNIDKGKLFNVDKNNFDKVIYIKEITRVQYIDSLVYYLCEIFKVLYGMPARRVVIEGYSAIGNVKLYPEYVPHYALKERDVMSGNIVMLGMQPNLMDDILHNSNNISILIVLDRGGYSVPHIKGDNVEYFYTASDVKDVPKDVPKDRIISYADDTLYVPFIENFEDLDNGQKMTKYSSTTIVNRIAKLIERR